jgi:membrane-bound inhibitor of C-type lysozyme
MKGSSMVGGALGWWLVSASAIAASSMQPPMNEFYSAFYNCADGGAFAVSYDSETPTTATITTNDQNKQYVLKRAQADNGVQFSNGAAKFWTDGKSVVVEGTRQPLKDCKRKPS